MPDSSDSDSNSNNNQQRPRFQQSWSDSSNRSGSDSYEPGGTTPTPPGESRPQPTEVQCRFYFSNLIVFLKNKINLFFD